MRLLVPAVLTLALSTGGAEACRCYPQSRAEIVQRADMVFEGTVAVVTRVPHHLQATIDVGRIEKGPLVGSVTVLTPDSSAACGIDLRVAQRVVVALVRDGRVFRTDLCMALALQPLSPVVPNR